MSGKGSQSSTSQNATSRSTTSRSTAGRSDPAAPGSENSPDGGGADGGTAGGNDALGYEQARDELAEVVARLEAGGLSLDESLTLWERGEHLARQCTAFLDGARERVETVLADADDVAAGEH